MRRYLLLLLTLSVSLPVYAQNEVFYQLNQKVAQSILGKLGCQTDVVANGLEAVNAFQQQTFDVILMDFQMPIMNGYIATQKIRQNPDFAKLPE